MPVSKTVRAIVFERDGNQCVYCGSRENLTIDHIVPVSRGGKNRSSNLQVLCLKCNSDKADSMPIGMGLPKKIKKPKPLKFNDVAPESTGHIPIQRPFVDRPYILGKIDLPQTKQKRVRKRDPKKMLNKKLCKLKIDNMRELITKCIKEHLVVQNPKGIPFAVERIIKELKLEDKPKTGIEAPKNNA